MAALTNRIIEKLETTKTCVKNWKLYKQTESSESLRRKWEKSVCVGRTCPPLFSEATTRGPSEKRLLGCLGRLPDAPLSKRSAGWPSTRTHTHAHTRQRQKETTGVKEDQEETEVKELQQETGKLRKGGAETGVLSYLGCVRPRGHGVKTLQVCSIQSRLLGRGDVLLQLGQMFVVLWTGEETEVTARGAVFVWVFFFWQQI